jgi:hypothetical protein
MLNNANDSFKRRHRNQAKLRRWVDECTIESFSVDLRAIGTEV